MLTGNATYTTALSEATTTIASTITLGSTARANAIAASRSAQSLTLVMPYDEPARVATLERDLAEAATRWNRGGPHDRAIYETEYLLIVARKRDLSAAAHGHS